jgi:SAM-dependent methyltransferase
VRVTQADAAGLPEGEYDVLFAFECLHDMPYPVEVLSAARRALRPGGAVVVMDEAVAEEFRPDGNLLERLMYGFSLLVCLPDGMAHPGSAGTGTVMRASRLRAYAEQAGLGAVSVLPIEDFGFWRFYELRDPAAAGPDLRPVGDSAPQHSHHPVRERRAGAPRACGAATAAGSGGGVRAVGSGGHRGLPARARQRHGHPELPAAAEPARRRRSLRTRDACRSPAARPWRRSNADQQPPPGCAGPALSVLPTRRVGSSAIVRTAACMRNGRDDGGAAIM